MLEALLLKKNLYTHILSCQLFDNYILLHIIDWMVHYYYYYQENNVSGLRTGSLGNHAKGFTMRRKHFSNIRKVLSVQGIPWNDFLNYLRPDTP